MNMDHELDPFDALVNIEEECIQRGREEGIKVGEERGYEEGYAMGYVCP